jgi:hypothetical protein
MLTYIESAVTRNASEKKINSLLDYVGSQAQDINVLQVGVLTQQWGTGAVGNAYLHQAVWTQAGFQVQCSTPIWLSRTNQPKRGVSLQPAG